MPRHPDPEVEQRILKAADALWKRGGERALTMRAVAQAAGTNTPAVYRRFKNRQDLIRALLLRMAGRLRSHFERGDNVEGMSAAYIDYALKSPYEYQLFLKHYRLLDGTTKRGPIRPIRESRPNFAFAEQAIAREFGGSPEEHSQFALMLWALLHGTVTLLLDKSVPEGHEEELLRASRAAVKTLIGSARK